MSVLLEETTLILGNQMWLVVEAIIILFKLTDIVAKAEEVVFDYHSLR